MAKIKRYDVIVIGIGAMGSAACYHLAKRGAAVLGLDQFDIPNTLASHHGHSRMIRLAYYEHPDYVPLLHRAYELWDELERESGRKLLHMTGGLYVGRPEDPFVAGSVESAREHGLPHEVLSRGAIADRYPQFRLPEGFIGLYEPKAGLLVPERVVETYAEIAREHGAELHANEPVTEIADGQVRSDRGSYHADHVICTQGAWMRDIGVELTVTRQIIGWVRPIKPQRFTSGVFPSFAISCPDGSAHYGFPLIEDVPPPGLLKIAHHWHDRATTPESINRDVEPTDEDDFRPALRQYLPDADGPLADIRICMYANTPDCHFIVDAHPNHANVTMACGFSGHGFKFASVVGEILTDLALEGRTQHPIDFFSLRRFA